MPYLTALYIQNYVFHNTNRELYRSDNIICQKLKLYYPFLNSCWLYIHCRMSIIGCHNLLFFLAIQLFWLQPKIWHFLLSNLFNDGSIQSIYLERVVAHINDHFMRAFWLNKKPAWRKSTHGFSTKKRRKKSKRKLKSVHYSFLISANYIVVLLK